MPVKKNNTVSKKKNTKIVTKSAIKNTKFSWRGIIVIIAIVAVGTVAIFAFAEDPATNVAAIPRKQTEGIVSYTQDKPVVIEKMNDGSIKTISSGRSINISKDGTVYCTPEDANTTRTATISAQEIARVRSVIESNKVNSLADDISSDNSAYVGSSRSLTYDKNGSKKRTTIYKKELETAGFQNTIAALENICVKATTPIRNEDVPSFVPPVTNPTSFKKPSLITKIAQTITPKVSAAYNVTLDPNSENLMRTNIDNTRAAYGKPKLNRSPCLDNAAREWSSYMAQNNILAHSHTVYGSILVLPEKYCGTIYGTAGENVGKAGTVDSMFNAYMNSPLHKANILGDYTFMGLGTYIQNGTGYQFNTQVFMSCTTCGSAATSSY